MRVLWIKSDFPNPADTGGKIRTRQLLRELARRVQVTFLSYVPPDLDRRYLEELRCEGLTVEAVPRAEEIKVGVRFFMRVLTNLLSPRPYFISKYIDRAMAAKVRELGRIQRHDVALCDFLEMAWCADHVEGIPIALFEHNVETLIWRRYAEVETNPVKLAYFNFEKRRVARSEQGACARFDRVFTVSDDDGKILQSEFGLRDFVTLPTGVDTEYFRPQLGEIDNRLVFCGSMDWMPNIDAFWWFYRSIYPRLQEAIPGLTFAVVGRRPPQDILAAAAQDSSLIVTGTVADVRPDVAAGQLYIVPLRVGGGTRIKIYEAMAMRRCVVSTTIGAEGLPLVAGEHLAIADGEADFANAVIELLQDGNKRDKMATAAYRLVTENYSWSRAADVLQRSLEALVSSRRVDSH